MCCVSPMPDATEVATSMAPMPHANDYPELNPFAKAKVDERGFYWKVPPTATMTKTLSAIDPQAANHELMFSVCVLFLYSIFIFSLCFILQIMIS